MPGGENGALMATKLSSHNLRAPTSYFSHTLFLQDGMSVQTARVSVNLLRENFCPKTDQWLLGQRLATEISRSNSHTLF